MGRGFKRGNLWYFHGSNSDIVANQASKGVLENEKLTWLWHQRLGHPSFGYLKHLLPSLFATYDKEFKCSTCYTCVLAKSHRTVFSLNNRKALMPFTLVYSDVWGPFQKSTSGGMRWFVTFIDDCTHIT